MGQDVVPVIHSHHICLFFFHFEDLQVLRLNLMAAHCSEHLSILNQEYGPKCQI